jgi:hypothetical protein
MSTYKNQERIEKLCSGFSLLDEGEQEYIFGVLQALLFAKKRTEKTITADIPPVKAERQKLIRV